MYLNEAKNEQEKKDLAIIIEEVLKQRIKGTKNEVGVWVTVSYTHLVIIGDAVAIIVAKQFFGGIGQNLSLIHI